MREFVFVVFCMSLIQPVFSQISGTYPDQLSSYFYNSSLINPAYIHRDGSSEAIVQSKVRSGIYKDIYTITATIQKVFQAENNKWHSARIILQNEKEGPYISTPRVYANYSIRIGLNENTELLGGVSIGLVNPNYRIPTKSVSTTLVDGALGMTLRRKNITLGISSNQVFDNSADKSRAIKLNRYYNTFFEITLIRHAGVEVKTHLLWTYFSDIPSQYNSSFSILWAGWFEAGLGYKYRQGAIFYSAIILDKTSRHPIRFGMLYNSTVGLIQANALSEAVEFTLIYSY